jgi:hypothetical protein
MSIIRLAANMVESTDGSGNYGHLQIVNSFTNQDIEGKSSATLTLTIDDVNTHTGETDYSPGSTNEDPS